jgi:hypothetical protein
MLPSSYAPAVEDDRRPLIIQCLDWAEKLSNEELREVLEHLSFKLKMRLKEASLRAVLVLRTGDWVENLQDVRKLPAGARGHITDIRRDKIDVHFPDHGHFTMPASMVRKTDPPPEAPK